MLIRNSICILQHHARNMVTITEVFGLKMMSQDVIQAYLNPWKGINFTYPSKRQPNFSVVLMRYFNSQTSLRSNVLFLLFISHLQTKIFQIFFNVANYRWFSSFQQSYRRQVIPDHSILCLRYFIGRGDGLERDRGLIERKFKSSSQFYVEVNFALIQIYRKF